MLHNRAVRIRLMSCMFRRYFVSKAPSTSSSTCTRSTKHSVYPEDGKPAYANYSLIEHMGRLNDERIKDMRTKNPPVSKELTNALLANPYAQMLSTVIRRDAVTRQTYPNAFLVKFNLALEEDTARKWFIPNIPGVAGELTGESVWVGNRRCILSELGSSKQKLLRLPETDDPYIRADVFRYAYNLYALKLKSKLQQMKRKLDEVPSSAISATPIALKSDHFIVTQGTEPIEGLNMILTWNRKPTELQNGKEEPEKGEKALDNITCETDKDGNVTLPVFLPLPDPSPEIGRLCLVDIRTQDSAPMDRGDNLRLDDFAATTSVTPSTTKPTQFRVPCYPIDLLLGPEAITIGNGEPIALLATPDTVYIAQLLWQMRLMLIDEPSAYASTISRRGYK